MKRYYVLIALMIVLPQFMMAQNFADAYRMSHNQIQGTARSAGMGNAMGALGGDFTSLSINPAGSAIYQTGEFVITPSYYINQTDQTIGGRTFSDNDHSFALNNMGAIGVFKTPRSESGIISVNYGIGYNRLANFNSNSFADNYDSGRSYLDNIADYANSQYDIDPITKGYLGNVIGDIPYRNWPTKLAWENYLINQATDNGGNVIDGLYRPFLGDNVPVDQQRTYSTDGRIDEYVFNVSLNFNHNFYIGATLGFHDITYKKNVLYEEFFGSGGDMAFWDDYYMDGSGFNVKLGAIFKPTQNVRIGLAFHSPTFYDIEEESILEMQSTKQENGSVDPGHNYYNYNFNTPLKVVASGAAVFGKRGLISADVEYMNYASMRFRKGGNGSDNFNDLNSVMGDNFNSVVNIRLGAEYRLTNQFTLRAGYERYGNPFEDTLDQQNALTDDISVFSGGFGYTVNAFSINLAYTNSGINSSQGNPQPNYTQLPSEQTNHNILMTLGFRF